MLLDPKIVLKDAKMKKTFELWLELSNDTPNSLLLELNKVPTPEILFHNAKEALANSDVKRLTKILELAKSAWFGNARIASLITKLAIETNKLAMVYQATKQYMQADQVLSTAFSEDFDGILSQVRAIPGITPTEIVELTFSGVITNRGDPNKLTILHKWLQLQKQLLTKALRGKITLPKIQWLLVSMDISLLKANPTLLEFQNVPLSIAKYATRYNKLEFLEYLEGNKIEFEKKTLLNEIAQDPTNDRKTIILWMLQNKYPQGAALTSAVDNVDKDMVDLLLNNGAKVNVDHKALITAIVNEDIYMVETLLKHEADCNIQIPINPDQLDETQNYGAYSVENFEPLTPLGAAILYYNSQIFPLIASRVIFDKRPHALMGCRPISFGYLLNGSSQVDVISEHLKLLGARTKPIGMHIQPQLEGSIVLG